MTIDRRAFLGTSMAIAATMGTAPARAGTRTGGQPPQLGVCYYPEQWPHAWWASDAADMANRGISYARIGEFAWALMEPEDGRYNWAWLDDAIATMGRSGVKVVLGTPTATPPKWLVDKYPEILPVALDGQVRGFGSRRHCTLSSQVYWRESRRIVSMMVERYGRHPDVAGWQVDNELGCHDTVLSWGPVDLAAWKLWLRNRYATIDALNEAWGTSFWSMHVNSFDDIELPARAVTETDPTARMDFRRFSAEQLVSYARMQAGIIRAGSPGRFVTTNAMAFFPDFDHFALGREMDFMSWDSYPLGHTAEYLQGEALLERYARTGHPDVPAFNHDLIRGASGGRPFWIMEQQPGPVNWSPWNGVPEPGMVRTWIWEAFGHGAETVSMFRWRQATFGQEEMHAGLNRPDRKISPGGLEVEQVHREIAKVGALAAPQKAQVALVYDYESIWYAKVQPQGADFNASLLAFAFYSALRRQGLDVDFVPPSASLAGYRLIVVPMLAMPTPAAVAALEASKGLLLFGPRSGSKTTDVHIPDELPPGKVQHLLPLKVVQVASMRPGLADRVTGGGISGTVTHWREWIETDLPALARFADGEKAIVDAGRALYVAGWPDDQLADAVIALALDRARLGRTALPEDVRLRRRGDLTFAVNYGATTQSLPAPIDARFVLGARTIAPHDVAIWRS